jgi:16S rRNA (guanine527-N7)-methyltransferase
MTSLSSAQIAALLAPYDPEADALLLEKLSLYLELLLRWNERTNLTAIRTPEQIVQRHFGESLFAARHLPQVDTLLDVGSGAGFPGLPIQLARPNLRVTLAESQHKKAAYLMEAVRLLEVPSEVWGRRVEEMPPARRFEVVTLRAVDRPREALTVGRSRLTAHGTLAWLTTADLDKEVGERLDAVEIRLPLSNSGVLRLVRVD